MTHQPDWRRSSEAARLDAIRRLLRAQFAQIAKAPPPALLIELAGRLERKAGQAMTACDDGDDKDGAGPAPPKASDA